MTSSRKAQAQVNNENKESLDRLVRALELSKGEFSLLLVQCDYQKLRKDIAQKIKTKYSQNIKEIELKPRTVDLQGEIQRLASDASEGVLIYGWERVEDLPLLLASANQGRDEFSHHIHFPVVLWMTSSIRAQLNRISPDFYSWASTPIEFNLSKSKLLKILGKTIDRVFKEILEAGTGVFLSNQDLELEASSRRYAEFKSAFRSLQEREVDLQLELEASIEFVLGRALQGTSTEAEHQQMARSHYERSVELWQQFERRSLSKSLDKRMVERKGCALYSLGLWWGSHGARHRSEYKISVEQGRVYTRKCIELFGAAGRPELVERFINALALSIQLLNHLEETEETHSERISLEHTAERWNELEEVSSQALLLHQQFSQPYREARAYGFLAEVSLSRSDWKESKRLAQKALSIIMSQVEFGTEIPRQRRQQLLDWEYSYHQGWYLYTLAKATAELGEVKQAIAHLETGQKQTKAEYDPDLYIRLLNELRRLHFQQGEYRLAFEAKQQCRAIEQQYGIRAFIGAVPLKPERQIENPALPQINPQEMVAEEVNTPSRHQVVTDIFQRIASNEHKLTVLCGQSGSGKSSILQAGLIPKLKQNRVQARPITPILQRRYVDHWVNALGKSLEAKQQLKLPIYDYDSLIEYLRHSASDFLTVLIFDEFEELFFVCNEAEQKAFFLFLQNCLELTFVKVVISLREDHLHYMLRWQRLIPFDLLDRKVLYYIQNYLPQDAQAFLHSLSKEPKFSLLLEPDLIAELVQDLAGESGDIRPIELQVVGMQLETERIRTLAQYRERGPKEALVIRFLQEVLEDCGEENEEVSGLILYLLTDENNTRPFKTQSDFESYLDRQHSKKVELVLEILTNSWIIIKEHDGAMYRYRLTYDYLVPFIRQNKDFNLRFELKQTKEQLRQALQQELQARLQAESSKQKSELAEADTQCLLAQSQFLAGDQIGSVVASIKAARYILSNQLEDKIGLESLDRVRQVIYGVKEMNRIEGHSAGVWDVSYSPQGNLLATASVDETIGLWNLDGSLVRKLRGHEDWIWSIAFREDGQLIASASDDNTARVWDLEGNQQTVFKGHSASVRSVRFSPTEETVLASCSEDKTVKLWNLAGQELLTFSNHTGGLRSVRFSPDGNLIASGGDDHVVKLWWRQSGQEILTFEKHEDAIWSVRFSPTGDIVASASADKTVRLWGLDGEEKLIFRGHNAIVRGVRFSADGSLLASASADGVIKIWRPDGTEVQTIKGHSAGVRGLSFSPDKKTLVSAGSDKTVRMWRVNGRALMTLRGHKDWVWGVAWNSKDDLLASVGADTYVNLWNRKDLKRQPLRRHTDLIRGVDFSADGNWLASGSADKLVVLWHLKDSRSRTLKGHEAKVWSVAFSPDSELVASASDDRTVKLWSIEDVGSAITLPHDERIKSVRFSYDGQTVISGSVGGMLSFWSRDGYRKHKFQAQRSSIRSMSVHPQMDLIAIASPDSIIKLWSFSGQKVRELAGHRAEVWSVAFSPDGQLLASASADRTVRLWRVQDGTEVKIFQGHEAAVLSVSFSSDGKTLASASEDRTIKLWWIDQLEPQTPDLHSILRYGCNWLQDYLKTSPNVSDRDRYICTQPL